MAISLRIIGPNHTEVNIGGRTVGGRTLVFSYTTLVAVKTGNDGLYKTNQFHSKTTSKHINASGFKDATPVSPDELAMLAEGEG